jgi:DNA polymerase I
MKTLYILDAVAYLFRSYYAIRGMTNQRGEATNALYGFIRSVQKIQKDYQPDHLIAVFDGPNNKASRTAIYKEYKSNRDGMPEDMVLQLKQAHEFCTMAGIPYLSVEGVEADDTIGTIAKWAETVGTTTYMCSSDKDLCQLITDKVLMLNTHKDNLLVNPAKVEELHGVKPEQIIDYLAIMGDSSDNIPGIPSFGAKTASSLLKKFGTLEYILSHPEEMGSPKKQETVRNNTELATLSKQLATIQLDIPISHDTNDYLLKEPNREALGEFYQEMNFRTLFKEISEPPKEKKPEGNYQLIDSEPELNQLLVKLMKAKEICIDTETTELSPLKGLLVGMGFAIQEGSGFYVPTNGRLGMERVIEAFKPLLEDPSKKFIGHNIKYDAHILANHNITLSNMSFDTMLASYLIRPERNRHSLDTLALEILEKQMTSITELIGTGKKQISMKDVEIDKVACYCCADVDYTLQLKTYFEQELKERNLENIFHETEMPLIPVLFAMERHGIFVDPEELKQLSSTLTHAIAASEKAIYIAAGEEFNINSPKQLSQILFTKLGITPKKKRGKTEHLSTGADVLEGLRHEHPICGDVLTYRGLEKLRSTYVDALPTQINPVTKRIHCSFNQSVTATGRLSCHDPNLQNIPIRTKQGREIRKAFKPEKNGWSFLAADYSQIELRLLAAFSGESALIQAFLNGDDIHAFTAAQVFGVPLSEVTSEMRSRAKAVNFGIIYGQQAFGLAQNLGISMSEAATFIKTYFARYPLVESYIEHCKQVAREKGYAETILGRKRPIPEITAKNGMLRAQAERLAVNSPLQGSQADIIKMAMISIEKKMMANNGYMVLQIHDELVFELPDEEICDVKNMVIQDMEGVIKLPIPLTVDIQIGKNWAEC